jgi:hypothetical protein
MPAPAVVLLVLVVVVIVVLVAYLLAIIAGLRQIAAALDETIASVGGIIEKSAPVEEIVGTINTHLDAGVSALEGLLVKKAGLGDALGLIEGIYPGAAAQGLRDVPGSATRRPPRIAEVYTRGVLSLARLGREAPIAAASPDGPAVRDALRSAGAALTLYPDVRHGRPERLPRSPVIGVDSPVQYVPSDEPGTRKRMPVRTGEEA